MAGVSPPLSGPLLTLLNSALGSSNFFRRSLRLREVSSQLFNFWPLLIFKGLWREVNEEACRRHNTESKSLPPPPHTMAAQDDDFPELENEEVIVENTAKRLAIFFRPNWGKGRRNTCPEVKGGSLAGEPLTTRPGAPLGSPDSSSGCHLPYPLEWALGDALLGPY